MAAKAGVQPDVVKIFLGEHFVDADERGYLPLVPLPDKPGTEICNAVGT